MAYSTLATKAATDTIAATDWNQARDNDEESAAGKASAAGEVPYATGVNALAMLALGAAGDFLRVNAGATAPEWGGMRLVLKTANQTINNTATFQDDDHVKYNQPANQSWFFIMVLFVQGPTAGDIKFKFTIPASATIRWGALGGALGQAGFESDRRSSSVTGTLGAIVGTHAGEQMIILAGSCTTAGTAGDVQLQWAQNVATASNTTVLQASFLIALGKA